MNVNLLAALAVIAAYLIGAIPFGYLFFRAVRGVDIRTVGSGNIGATNVGRQLGFRYFVLVFLLDMGKGLLPTWGLPLAVARASGVAPSDLRVLVALAAILGHNFPVYLKFRGGKGVATSIGVVLALDWIASVATILGFLVFLIVTRYVSLSSLMGGLVFMLVYFTRVDHPWSRPHRAMSLFTLGLVVLLFVRHRKNLTRIFAGTEPKVAFRKPKGDQTASQPTSGRISWALVLVIACVALGGSWVAWTVAHRPELRFGSYRVTEVARAATNYQRADRVAFADGGKRLAVTCPRYQRLVLLRVTDRDNLEIARDIPLEGQPVALRARNGRLILLLRPPGDSRHVEPGWWETLDLEGRRIGVRHMVGFYPDDLAVSPDGRLILVLTSGRAEGDANRPAPALTIFRDGEEPRALGRIEFDEPGDDPARIRLSRSGGCAVVTLNGTKQAASIDVSDPAHPRLLGRSPLPDREVPYLSWSDDDSIFMPVASASEAVRILLAGPSESIGPELVASTLPHGSGLRFDLGSDRRVVGRLELHGPFHLGRVRPMGIDCAPERGLIAVANRSGSVHLIAIRPGAVDPRAAPVASREATPPHLATSTIVERGRTR